MTTRTFIDRRAASTPTVETPTPEQVEGLFVWDREVPEAWQATLDRLAPPSDGLATYRLVWEPGEPDAPIQRWVIWQMRPKGLVEKLMHAARQDITKANPKVVGLLEEHPRKDAKWDPVGGCYRKLNGKLAKTDRLTWELYHHHGEFGERFWIIQGDRGGHKWQMTQNEKRMLWLATNGTMKDVPFPGDLPYAPFDMRVMRHLLDIERVLMTRRVLQYAANHEALLDAEELAEVEAARGLYFDWLGEQFAEVADEYRPMYRRAVNNRPTGMKPREAISEAEQREVYAKTGQMVG